MYQYKYSDLLDLLLKFTKENLIGQEQKVKIKGIYTFLFIDYRINFE